MKPRLLRKRYFVWLMVPAALIMLNLVCGLPHLCVAYSWLDHGQGYDPYADRYYTHCAFIGPFGRFDADATDGACPWVRFYQRQETPHGG